MVNSNKIYRLMLNKDHVDSFPERRLLIYPSLRYCCKHQEPCSLWFNPFLYNKTIF